MRRMQRRGHGQWGTARVYWDALSTRWTQTWGEYSLHGGVHVTKRGSGRPPGSAGGGGCWRWCQLPEGCGKCPGIPAAASSLTSLCLSGEGTRSGCNEITDVNDTL